MVNFDEKERFLTSDLTLYPQMTFETFSGNREGVADAYNAACVFADNPQDWIAFYGPPGVGKTHLAAAIANHIYSRGGDVYFTNLIKLSNRLPRDIGDPPTDREFRVLKRLQTASLLIMEDGLQIVSNKRATKMLHDIAESRWRLRLPIVFTGHQDIRQFDTIITQYLFSPGNSRVHYIQAADYRLVNRP